MSATTITADMIILRCYLLVKLINYFTNRFLIYAKYHHNQFNTISINPYTLCAGHQRLIHTKILPS